MAELYELERIILSNKDLYSSVLIKNGKSLIIRFKNKNLYGLEIILDYNNSFKTSLHSYESIRYTEIDIETNDRFVKIVDERIPNNDFEYSVDKYFNNSNEVIEECRRINNSN